MPPRHRSARGLPSPQAGSPRSRRPPPARGNAARTRMPLYRLPHQQPAWYHRIIVERIDRLGTLSHTKEDGIMRLHLRQAGTLIVAAAVAISGLAARPAAPARATAGGGTLLVARDIRDGKTMDPGRFYEFTSIAM